MSRMYEGFVILMDDPVKDFGLRQELKQLVEEYLDKKKLMEKVHIYDITW